MCPLAMIGLTLLRFLVTEIDRYRIIQIDD